MKARDARLKEGRETGQSRKEPRAGVQAGRRYPGTEVGHEGGWIGKKDIDSKW